MQKQLLKSYMRHLRRHSGLTQRNLGRVMRGYNQAQISMYERRERDPDLRMYLKFLIFFELCGREPFPALMEELEEELIEDARQLYEELQGDPSSRNNDQLDTLEAFLERTDKQDNQN